MHHEIPLLTDIAIAFAVAAVVAVLLSRLRVPLVLAYMGTGLLLGPAGVGLVEQSHDLSVLAEVGVALLLFTLGLEFSLEELRRSWRTIVLAGAAQVLVTVGVVAGVAVGLGESVPKALTWGFLVSLSSTAVVLRLLDMRGETKAAHGRFVVGVLVFQDLAVIAMLLMLPILGGEASGAGEVLLTLGKSGAIVVAILIASTLVVPPGLRAIARTQNREVFLLSVLAIAGLTAFATSLAGLSLALGAFLAGMAVAGTHFAHQALSDVLPLRSAMMCLFFVTIGLIIEPNVIVEHPGTVAALLAAVVLGKFLLVLAVGMALRFPFGVAALAGAALAQVGEFSFVLASAAMSEGLLSSTEHEIFLAASVLSIVVAPVVLSVSPRVLAGTRSLKPVQKIFGPDLPQNDEVSEDAHSPRGHIVIVGFGVGGRTLAEALDRTGVPSVVVELNPETVREERARGRHILYGDGSSAEILEHAGMAEALGLVVMISEPRLVNDLSSTARHLYPQVPQFLRTRWATEEGSLREGGAVVVSEEFAGAAALSVAVLKHLGNHEAHEVIDAISDDHARLPPGVEVRVATGGQPA